MAKIIGNTTATPNPRPDWNQTDENKADYIKNKPDIAALQDELDNHTHTKEDVGLDNVENKSSEVIRSELTKENITNALGYTPPMTDTVYDDTALKNTLNSKAPLDSPVFTGDNMTVWNGLTMTSSDANKHNSHFSMNRKPGTGRGAYSMTGGFLGEATSMYSVALGQEPQALAQAAISMGAGTYAAHIQGQTSLGKFNAENTNAQFMVGIGTSVMDRRNGLLLKTNGECHAMGYGTNTTADFAEYFEWEDGNINDEDRRGRFVALEGDKIRFASADDNCLGVISATGAYIGNCASLDWHKRYLTDIFGEVITEEIEVSAMTDEETGEVLIPAHIEQRPVINPEYNPNVMYIPRSERKEWAVVGMLGQIVVVDDGTCVVGGKVKPGIDGIGTISDDGTGYTVMKRLDENHIKVLVK